MEVTTNTHAGHSAVEYYSDSQYPAPSSTVQGTVNGVATEVEIVQFEDRVLVTICQGGRLAQWIEVGLAGPSAGPMDLGQSSAVRGVFSEAGMLPSALMTPKTLFGGGGTERETFGHLVAAQIATSLHMRNTDDRRTLVVGMGMAPGQDLGRVRQAGETEKIYDDILSLVHSAM